MANTTNRTTRIKHVFGNVLKLAIPLTLRTVTLEGGIVEVTDTDYTPSNHYPVVVQFVNGPLKYELDATIRDNYIAVVEDKGTIPVGNYAIVVLCKDDNGDPRRFKQRCVLEVVDVTADAGIEVGIEFEAQEWLLDGAIFLAIKGEDGIDGVGIESITTDETSVSGEYNQVTFHLTNGSSYTLNVRNGESTEQTLPANVVVDENYVHTDNNYTDTDKQKIESVDKLFADAEYDRISRRLNFFKHGDTMHTNPLKSIDITDFVRDSRVSSFRIIDGNLTIKLNSDGNNEEFKVPITSINANYYTKSQVDSLYSSLSSRVTPVEVIFTESNDSITSNRTINGIYTDYTNKKPIIGKYGSSVGVLLYISSQEAAFLFGDRYDKPFILRNSGSMDWGKEDLVDDSSSIVIDDAPTPESDNAVSSGSVWYYLTQRIQSVTINGTTKTPDENGDVSFTVQDSGGYEPPVGGIPKSDLAQSVQDTLDDVSNKVDKVTGKGLSTNDYTTAEKTKLAELENYDDSALQTAIGGKVDKESGKSLMTDAEHTKLAGIAAGAEVNVQANWTQTNTSADDYIKNKPTLATVATSGSYNDLQDKPTIPAGVTVDQTITQNGTNPVRGSAIYSALEGKEDKALVVEFTYSNDEYSANKTFEEIGTALSDGFKVVGIYGSGLYQLAVYEDSAIFSSCQGNYFDYFIFDYDEIIHYEGLLTESKVYMNSSDMNSDEPEGGTIGYIFNDGFYLYDNGLQSWKKLALSSDFSNYVPTARKINNKPLSSDITLNASDVGALPATTTIPTNVSDLTNDSGFTSNAGTITGITMNGASKGTSGVVNLGTVITAHQDISGKANSADLATVATSGSYNDLSNKPTIPDTSTLATKTELNGKQDKINDLASIRINSGKGVADMSSNNDGTVVTTLANGDTYTIDLNHEHPQYVESDDLADVATTGSYDDLTDKPNIPQNVISGVTFNGTSAPITNGVAAITATIPDVSGKANASEMAVSTSGDQTTITLKTGTSATVINQHQSLSGYVKYVLLADEAAYEALATKDSGTLYLIPES